MEPAMSECPCQAILRLVFLLRGAVVRKRTGRVAALASKALPASYVRFIESAGGEVVCGTWSDVL